MYQSWSCLSREFGTGLISDEIQNISIWAACMLYYDGNNKSGTFDGGYIESDRKLYELGGQTGMVFRVLVGDGNGIQKFTFMINVADLRHAAQLAHSGEPFFEGIEGARPLEADLEPLAGLILSDSPSRAMN